jgi:methylglutaconyl-CoA hydratase
MFRRQLLLRNAKAECTLTISDYVAQVVISRPERKNALGKQLLHELRENFLKCHHNPAVRAVVLSSAVEGVFCAGADLKERKEMSPEEAREFVNKLRSTFCQIEDLSVPVISAIEGAALGGGLEIALATDIRIAGGKALLGVPETGLAIIPGAGGTQRLTKIVGIAKAKELTFTAKPVRPDVAERIGLVNHAVEAGKAVERATELAIQIVANGPIAVAAAKTAIVEGFGLDRNRGMLVEQLCYEKVLASEDRLEGLKAFAEKRKPVYKGK